MYVENVELIRLFGSRQNAFGQKQNLRIHFILHMRKASSGPLLSIHTFYCVNNFVSGQQKPWLNYMDEQADLSFRCPHMSEDMFSHGAIHLLLRLIYVFTD